MKYRHVKILVGVSMAFFMAACSSSLTRDEDSPDEPAETADAGTDALPPPDAENPAPPKDAADAPPPPAPDAPPPPAPDAPPPPAPVPEASASPAPVADAPAPVTPPPAPVAAAPETPAPAAPAPTDSSDSYVVKRGDTLMKIAYETCGDLEKWHNLFDLNRGQIQNPNLIEPGQTLKIEKCSSSNPGGNGEKYLIKQGDTLGKISDSLYGTPSRWKDLWHNNRQLIKNPNRIFAGFYLYYTPSGDSARASESQPAAESAPAAAPADQSAAGGGPGPASVSGQAAPMPPAPAALPGAPALPGGK